VNGNPACPNEQPQFVHDFGSILGYTEYVFGGYPSDPDDDEIDAD
jgi:hypothetical protein